MPRCSSTGALTLESTSLLSGEQTWTQEFPSTRTAGNGATPLSCAEYRALNASSVMVLTSQRTTENSDGAAKQTTRSTLQDWKQRKENPAPTHSNAWTAMVIIKLTQMHAPSGDTISIGSDRWRNILRSVKTGQNPSIQKRTLRINNEVEFSQNSIAKCLEKLTHCPSSTWNSERFQCHPNSRTPMVRNLKGPKLVQQWRRTPHRHQSPLQLDHIWQIPYRQ